MNKPHKHAELIKAWADGAEIEFKSHGGWRKCNPVDWNEHMEFRIKPEPKPDHITYPETVTSYDGGVHKQQWWTKDKLKLVFDGETGKLKSAEVL